jgi:hypothetical protein
MKIKEKKSTAQNTKVIESNKKIAAHLEEAAKKHREAASLHELEEHDKACRSLVKASNHLALAAEAQADLLKHYSFTS